MAIDDRTPALNLPKPNQDNTLFEDVARLRSALDAIDAAIMERQTALGFSPENVANKGAVNGYAGLDATGKVPSSQLPSYVDDVLEYPDLAAFPGVGETGKIYVTLDNGRLYRWSGSDYVWISPSPGSTDAVPEGVTNKYFTDARARAAQLPATASAVGVVKIGPGLSVGLDGTLSAVGGGSGTGVPAFNELTITPTSNGQTVFAPIGGYSVGQIELFLNGVLLYGNGDDYTASNGTSITLVAGINTTDTLLLRRWTTTVNLPFSSLVDKPTTLAGYGIGDEIIPAGTVIHVARTTGLPPGWLKANGAAVSRTAYAALFAAIGTTFGVGDGVNTFNLPDLRGEFIRGWDEGRGADPGRAFGSFQGNTIQSHTHSGTTYANGAHAHTVGGNNANGRFTATGWPGMHADLVQYTSTEGNHAHGFVTDASGSAETRPRNIALLAYIKF